MPIGNLALSGGRSSSGDTAAAAAVPGSGSKGATPALSSSPDALACYQAAAVAAAGGYPAILGSHSAGSGNGSPLAAAAEAREGAVLAAGADSA